MRKRTRLDLLVLNALKTTTAFFSLVCLAANAGEGGWGQMMESALTRPLVPRQPSADARAAPQPGKRIRVPSGTRWG